MDRRPGVTRPHRPDSDVVLEVRRGTRLRFERRRTPWEGWIWCTREDGVCAWVAESWVAFEGDACIMLRDYESRELSIDVGDEVVCRFTERGWAWVRNGDEDEGWVPLDCLEKIGEQGRQMRKSEDEIEIRPIDGAEEIETCARIMVSSEPWITLKRTYEDSVKMMGDERRETYVARAEDEIAGFLILRMDGPFPGFIQTVGVAPEWRRRGVGSKLVEFAEERIFRDSPNVFMCVSSFNPDALRLYERLRYEVIGEIKEFIVKGHSEILLRKSVAPLYDYFKLGTGRPSGKPRPASP